VLLSDSFDTENGGLGAAEYSGFANFTSFALHYDLVFLGSFVAWGLIVAAATRRRA